MEKRDLNIICDSAVNWRMYQDKTVFVTGATGRIGMYILETLVDVDIKYNLNMRIVGICRSPEKAKKVFGNTLDFPNVTFIYQDINAPVEYVGKIDYIFHTAGPAAPIDYKISSVNTLWAHVNGTHNMLECARLHNTKRFFYVSTVEVYGDCKGDSEITEGDMGALQHLNYRACYPEAKRLCETMLTTYKQDYGLSFCGVRMSHTLGPGISLTDGRGFAEFLKNVLDGEDIVLHSDGSAVRPYTYVADAVNAMFLVMDKGDDTMYNVAANENLLSIRELAGLIADLSPTGKTKVRFSEETGNLPYLPYKLAIMDTSKIRELGWKPQVDVSHVFQWTLESFL